MTAVWALSGAVTDTTAVITGKVSGASVRVAVSTSADLSTPTYSTAQAPDANGYIRRSLTGLTPRTRYYAALEIDGVIDMGWVDTFSTDAPPGEPMSMRILVGSCHPGSGNPASTHQVFNRIAEKHADMFIHLGDLGYPNIATNNPALFRASWDAQLSATVQGAAFRSAPLYYVWDDHDYGPDNSDRTSPGRSAAAQGFRDIFPHPPLPESGAIYHPTTKGRLRFLFTDQRYYRDPYTDTDGVGKTMLGADQFAWLLDEVEASKAAGQVAVWCSSQVLHVGDGTISGWGAYATERQALWDGLVDRGITTADLFILCGDPHVVGFRRAVDFSTSQTLPLRCYTSSGLDSSPPGGAAQTILAGYDRIHASNGAGLYATLDVVDDGTRITFTFTGYLAARTTTEETVQMTDTWTVGPESGIYRAVDGDGVPHALLDSDGEQRYITLD